MTKERTSEVQVIITHSTHTVVLIRHCRAPLSEVHVSLLTPQCYVLDKIVNIYVATILILLLFKSLTILSTGTSRLQTKKCCWQNYRGMKEFKMCGYEMHTVELF